MSRRAHVLWLIAVVASGAVFIFSLGSDVWEAYLVLFLALIGAYLFLLARSSRSL